MLPIILLMLLLLLWLLSGYFLDMDRKYLSQALKHHHKTRQKSTADFTLKTLKPFFLLGRSINLSFVKLNPTIQQRWLSKLTQAGLIKELPLHDFEAVLKGCWLSAIISWCTLMTCLETPLSKGVATCVILYFCVWPIIWLEERAQIRCHQIIKQLPTISSAIAITMASGLSFYQAIIELTRIKKGPLIDELTTFLDDVTFGHSRIEALDRMGHRVKLGEMTLLITLLKQGLQMGAYGLSDQLQSFSNDLWLKRVERAKLLAAKASIKLFLPLLLLVLPAMFIFILSPAVFSIVKFFV